MILLWRRAVGAGDCRDFGGHGGSVSRGAAENAEAAVMRGMGSFTTKDTKSTKVKGSG